jgi:hypothetical protein
MELTIPFDQLTRIGSVKDYVDLGRQRRMFEALLARVGVKIIAPQPCS